MGTKGDDFGGLFDFNGDGKTDLGEQFLAYQIFEQTMRDNSDDEELAKIANKGDEFLDSENVDEIESSSFIILTDNEEIGEDDGEPFRMGGM